MANLSLMSIIGAFVVILFCLLINTLGFFGEDAPIGFIIPFGVALWIIIEQLTRSKKE